MPWNKDGSRKQSAFYKMKGPTLYKKQKTKGPLKARLIQEGIESMPSRDRIAHQEAKESQLNPTESGWGSGITIPDRENQWKV